MDKEQLRELYEYIEEAVEHRRTLGEFDANSKHIMLLLRGMQALTAHAINAPLRALSPPPKSKK
jgi:hypothetical protein